MYSSLQMGQISMLFYIFFPNNEYHACHIMGIIFECHILYVCNVQLVAMIGNLVSLFQIEPGKGFASRISQTPFFFLSENYILHF